MQKSLIKEALKLAGTQHRYQKNLVVIIAVAWVEMMIAFLVSSFIYMNPTFSCQSDPIFIFNEKQACPSLSQCQTINNFNLVSELGLYCSKQFSRLAIQSVFPLGAFIGLVFLNLWSDWKGRRPAFIFTVGISTFSVILTIYGGKSGNISCLILSQFLMGLGSYPVTSLAYSLLTDFLSDSLRKKAIVLLHTCAGFSAMIMGFAYLLEINWFYFVIFFQLIPLIFVFVSSCYFILESPYILRTNDKIAQAESVLLEVAKYNGRQDQIVEIKAILEIQKQNKNVQKQSLTLIFQTLRQWKCLKPIIILTGVVFIANLNHLGISFSLSKTGLGYGYNILVMGLAQTGAVFFLDYSAKYIPRKIGISGSFIIVMLIGFLFSTETVSQSSFYSMAFIALSRMFAINAYCLAGVMQTETFSVFVQSTAVGVIEGIGITGATVVPLIIRISESYQIHPITICAVCVGLGIWPTMFLKQTLNRQSHAKESTSQLKKNLIQKQFEMQQMTASSSPSKINIK